MKHLRTSLAVLLFLTVVLGGLYPLLVTGIGALAFPRLAGGSLVMRDGRTVGSRLIGQEFTDARYFHPRPSAGAYGARPSGASNLGPTSRALKQAYDQRRADWQQANPAADGASGGFPPMEMLFASGSGLDPDISPLAAEQQVPRVAAARRLSAAQADALLAMVRGREVGPQVGFLGEPRVNVLELNLDLDRRFP
jgi:potassium-transporting ATPase KdpC subunit